MTRIFLEHLKPPAVRAYAEALVAYVEGRRKSLPDAHTFAVPARRARALARVVESLTHLPARRL